MNRTEVAALLAYAVRLDPRLTPESQADAAERLDQWYELLADVPPTAPHPDGRDWNAAHVVKHHISSSPYRIQRATSRAPGTRSRPTPSDATPTPSRPSTRTTPRHTVPPCSAPGRPSPPARPPPP